MNARQPSAARAAGRWGWLLVAWALAGLLAWPGAQAQTRRVALVVGNANYPQKPLANPVNDATDLAAALRRLGFEVLERQNRSADELRRDLADFQDKLSPGAVGLFYFAGHGVQGGRGLNYLLPVGVDYRRERDAELYGLEAGTVLRRMEESGAALNLVILDACRDSPLPSEGRSTASRGLGRMDAPTGSLIAFATAPGSTADENVRGRNGLYTQHLLRAIEQPGLRLEDVFKRVRRAVETDSNRRQSPEEISKLTSDEPFYFRAPAAAAAPATAVVDSLAALARPAPATSVNLADLEREETTRKQWAQWQSGMQTDHDRTAAFNGSPDLQAKAWERFLAAWPQDNPLSRDDDRLREQARGQLARAQRAAEAALVAVATPRAPVEPARSSQNLDSGYTAAPDMGFPQRPITIVVPFAPGGTTDVFARSLGESLRAALGGQALVNVENVPGAGGSIGANKVARATADGYTLLLHGIGLATTTAMYRNPPFRPLDDFEFVGLVTESPLALVGRPSLPANSAAEVLRWLRAHVGATMASAGQGSTGHLCNLLLTQATGAALTHVPYRGTAPAISDLMAGQIDVMCAELSTIDGQVSAGRIKGFALTSGQRPATAASRNLPTLGESGAAVDITTWNGLYAPRGTPAAVIARLNGALRTALQSASFKARADGLSAVVVSDNRNTPAGHKRFVESEINRWTPLIRAAGEFAD